MNGDSILLLVILLSPDSGCNKAPLQIATSNHNWMENLVLRQGEARPTPQTAIFPKGILLSQTKKHILACTDITFVAVISLNRGDVMYELK